MLINRKIKTYISRFSITIGFLALAGNANAQFGNIVFDPTAHSREVRNFVQTQTHYGSQISHYAEQIKKYEEQISQLEREYDSITGIKFSQLFDLDVHGAASRVLLTNALEGKANEFGLGLPDTPTEEMKVYHKTYRLIQPEELHPDNIELQKQVRDLHQALFTADSFTAIASEARKDRESTYDELAELSAQAVDMKGALEVNNALLLENGRNLALLIDLQTAQLAAESVNLRDKAQSRQNIASVFGSTGDGF